MIFAGKQLEDGPSRLSVGHARPAASDFRRQAARRRPHPVRLQHPEGTKMHTSPATAQLLPPAMRTQKQLTRDVLTGIHPPPRPPSPWQHVHLRQDFSGQDDHSRGRVVRRHRGVSAVIATSPRRLLTCPPSPWRHTDLRQDSHWQDGHARGFVVCTIEG